MCPKNQDKTTIGWKFGNDDANPWKMSVPGYPLPVFYWQTSAPKADIEQRLFQTWSSPFLIEN